MFFFRLEKKKLKEGKKNTLVSFHRHHNHLLPRSETSISKITRRARGHEAKKKRKRRRRRRERSSFKGEERSYFIPIGRNPTHTTDFSFQFEGNRSASFPSHFPPPLQESRNERKSSLRVPATTRFKRQLYKNNIDPGIRRG